MTISHYDLVGTFFKRRKKVLCCVSKGEGCKMRDTYIVITSSQRSAFSFRAQYRMNSDQPNSTPPALTIDSANLSRIESSGGTSSPEGDGPFQSRLAVQSTESALNPVHRIYFSFLFLLLFLLPSFLHLRQTILRDTFIKLQLSIHSFTLLPASFRLLCISSSLSSKPLSLSCSSAIPSCRWLSPCLSLLQWYQHGRHPHH